MGGKCARCGMALRDAGRHAEWCGRPEPEPGPGVWFRSAASGMWYENAVPAGGADAVRIGGTLFVREEPPKDTDRDGNATEGRT